MEENLLKERKETLMALMNDKAYVPMKLKELAILLGVPKEDRGELEAVLKALMADGKIAVSKKGKYARAEIFAETAFSPPIIRALALYPWRDGSPICSSPRTTPEMPWTEIRSR